MKKLAAVILALVMAVSPFVFSGCHKEVFLPLPPIESGESGGETGGETGGESGGESGGETDEIYSGTDGVNILLSEKGYGSAWLYALREEFESLYPGIDVRIRLTSDDQEVIDELNSIGNSPYDLFFTCFDLNEYVGRSLAGEPLLAELSDVYENFAAQGESEKIIDKLEPDFIDVFRRQANGDDVYYAMPWTQSVSGIVYNATYTEEILGPVQFPRTTDELFDMAKTLTATGHPCLVTSPNVTYYNMLYTTWWAQYEGMEQILNFYSGLAPAGTNGEMVLSPQIAFQQGRLEAFNAAEQILGKTEVLLYDWPDVQEYFVGIEGAMYPCGDWFYTETREAFEHYSEMDIQFRRIPVISALGEKLGITDAELSLAVDYADRILSGERAQKPSISPASLTVDEVLDEVVKARSVTQTSSYSHTVAANAQSRRLEHAKNFLRLMASDRGQEVFSRALNGTAALPYGFDIRLCKRPLRDRSRRQLSLSPPGKAAWQSSPHFLLSGRPGDLCAPHKKSERSNDGTTIIAIRLCVF